MNKKLSIFAIVLIVVGLIGSIWSGFFSMPYFINKFQNYDHIVNKETTVYNENVNVNKLKVEALNTNIEILKSDSDNIQIKTKGLEDNSEINVISDDNTITVEEKYIENNAKIKSMDDFVDKLMEETFSNHRNTIIIYVPNKVDIDINSKGYMVNIEDDIFLNEFNFNTSSSYLSLPREVKNLKNMNITASNSISLQLNELLGIKNVTINCSELNIYSDTCNINDVEKYIPDNITINSDNLSNGYVNISSTLPICKNLIVNGYKSSVDLNLPLDRYKFNFDLQALDSIELNDYMSNIIGNNDKNKSDNNMEYNDEDTNNLNEVKEIKIIINENKKEEYKINISASNINFE